MINLCLDLLMEANLKAIPAQITSTRETPVTSAEETPGGQEPITHWVTNLGRCRGSAPVATEHHTVGWGKE